MPVSLPLLERATIGGTSLAILTPASRAHRGDPPPNAPLAETPSGTARMPGRTPGAGEQYRFHFDMRACIGCKCCVVACNEQNGNPADITWRRVGEIEGGWYPNTVRRFLSMGCNHCLEPTCLRGCPVDAYTKDPITGIVRHSAEACIGCQYCTWNCAYGVPQYNPERGVVGKCDLCHGRLALGQAPACVSACPEGAIRVEIVNVAEWKAAVAAGSDGAPVADHSIGTTRLSMPELPPDAAPRDLTHLAPEHPHWSLIIMTVLTQLSVGAFATIWLLQLFGASSRLGIAAFTSLAVGSLALAAATLHLGRPVYAYRALRMWRRSWLSREVVLFSAFSGVAAAYAAVLWFGLPGGTAAGGLTTGLGAAGVMASAWIYRVPSRPAWNTAYTPVEFGLTAGLLGVLFAAAVGAGEASVLGSVAAAIASAQGVVLALRFFRCIASDRVELRGTARLLATVLARHVLLRGILLAGGGVALPLLAAGSGDAGVSRLLVAAGFVAALGSELLGRYLFFVSVVPTHMAAPYLTAAREAA